MDADFEAQLRDGFKGDCPCCGRYAQVYRRSIHAVVARQLIRLYLLGGDGGFVHASKLIPEGQTGMGDFTKARYFGLILEDNTPPTSRSKRTSGRWALSEAGVAYVLNTVDIPRYLYVFDDVVIGESEESASIIDALGQKFDYGELLRNV